MKPEELIPDSVYYIECIDKKFPECSYSGKGLFTGKIEKEGYDEPVAIFDLKEVGDAGYFSEKEIKYLVSENPIYKDFVKEIVDELHDKIYNQGKSMGEICDIVRQIVEHKLKKSWTKK